MDGSIEPDGTTPLLIVTRCDMWMAASSKGVA
jgi:hypothetical protein